MKRKLATIITILLCAVLLLAACGEDGGGFEIPLPIPGDTHTVTFVDYYGNEISTETVNHGEAATAPEVPALEDEGLRFDSWDTDFSSVTSDLTVKALYTSGSYTVTYVTNNDQSIEPSHYSFDETPVAPTSPKLDGYYFIGWYLDSDFVTEYKFDAPLTDDITLYAYFSESIPISTIAEFFAIPEHSEAKFILKNDINCEGEVITKTIIDFAGTFDGNGHKIHNFVFTPTSAENSGIFDTNSGIIKDVTFDNFSYTLTNTNLNSNSGFLVGSNTGTIENVHISNSSLSYTYIRSGGGTSTSCYGGIAGENSGDVINCSVVDNTLYVEAYTASWGWSGTATAGLYATPLVGKNSGNIQNSETITSVTAYIRADCSDSYRSGNAGYLGLGGIASINNGTITGCSATLNTIASTSNYRTMESYIGGLVYKNTNSIENCSANTTLTCNGVFSYISAAGFVENNEGTIRNCYANTKIENTNNNSRFGGFVSGNTGGIYKCYAEGNIDSGAANVAKGGFVGYNNGNITSCFADVDIAATAETNFGTFVGNADHSSRITDCYYSSKATFLLNGEPQTFDTTYAEATDPLNLTDEEFIVGTLGWSADVWTFDANKFNYPTLK